MRVKRIVGRKLRAAGVAAMITLGGIGAAQAQSFASPDVLILGDSQISFGSGYAFLDFFADIKTHCNASKKQVRQLKKLGKMEVGVIGVRSTSIHSWTARSGASKGAVCDVDPKWKVNAGSYGSINKTKNQFVQIGQGRNYQFCKANTSPFEAMFQDGYYKPKLLLLTFLGNSAKRWAENKDLALQDVKRLNAQLPKGLPCIFMTTAPAYTKKVASQRLKAQENIKDAFNETGNRCTFVEGATPQTVAANQGNKKFFRLSKSGKVKDPYHPNKRGAKHFLSLEMDNICRAIFTELEGLKTPS